MKGKELIYQISGKSYIDVYLVAGNKIIDQIIEEDIGQRWLISKKLNKAFILPDRSEGLSFDRKTIFFYGAETATPLSIEEEEDIKTQNTAYLYGIDDNNRLIRYKNKLLKTPESIVRTNEETKKVKPTKLLSTTIEPQVLKSIIDTKVVSDLLKSNESIFETLKTPIIIGIIAVVVIMLMFTI